MRKPLFVFLGTIASVVLMFLAIERWRSSGSLDPVPEDPSELPRALDPSDHFADMPIPGPSDWLAQHEESGQTFAEFRSGKPNRPDSERNKIYFQPLGDFPISSSPDGDELRSFAETFFGMPVERLPAVSVDGLPIKRRDHQGNSQLFSTDVLDWLEDRLPKDAFCILAITMDDLYPADDWNFVFGQANLRTRVGVYSFHRYTPEFQGVERSPESESMMLQRSCKVLGHETGHMFGIEHCIAFHCLMNGSNNMQESDNAPLHLCPVCLRKLQSSVPFDFVTRYQALQQFSEKANWTAELAWLQKRIEFIGQ